MHKNQTVYFKTTYISKRKKRIDSKLSANGHNNSQHCWVMLVWQMLDGVGSKCAYTCNITHNNRGTCSVLQQGYQPEDFIIATVCKQIQHHYTVLSFSNHRTKKKCWLKSLTNLKLHATPNNPQQYATGLLVQIGRAHV